MFDFRENSILINSSFNRINKLRSNIEYKKHLNTRKKQILDKIGHDQNITQMQLSKIIDKGFTIIENDINFLRK